MISHTFDAATLPRGWHLKPLIAVADYFVSNVDKVANENEIPVRLCNYTDVYKNEFIDASMDFMMCTATDHEIKRFRLVVGDVVITKDSETWEDIAVPALVVNSAPDLVCGYHLAILRPFAKHLLGSFLLRCLQSRAIRLALELASTGVTRFGLPQGEIGRLLLPVPPLPEQQHIADYLDRETAEIDALIAEKNRMLTLLEEKRAALVTHAVTRGLDPDVRLKPSGLEWLGDVPAHWNVLQLKRTWTSAEYGLSESIREDGSVRVLRMSCITKQGFIDLNHAGQVDEVPESLLIHKGDILFNRTNSLDQIAKVGYLNEEPEVPTSFASYLVRIRVNDRVSVPYLVALLNSSEFIRFARSNAIPAIGQANLSPSRYGEIHVPLPPFSEQLRIIAQLNVFTGRSHSLAQQLQASLDLLKERRSALITAAVTGQIPIEEMHG